MDFGTLLFKEPEVSAAMRVERYLKNTEQDTTLFLYVLHSLNQLTCRFGFLGLGLVVTRMDTPKSGICSETGTE